MTYEDVRDIRNGCPMEALDNDATYIELSELIDKAIEKQIPKKPWEETNEKCSYYHFLYKGSRYCPECGQKLDWSDEE